jgi:hypothetical protein
MEDFFYFNITNNENIKIEIKNILNFLDNINKKINYTNIDIKTKEIDLIRFLLNKFKKIYLFQFMINPNETIENVLNTSFVLLFTEISNNLNYNEISVNNNDINYIDIIKNKSIYKFLEELEENKNTSTNGRLLELHDSNIKYLINKSDDNTNNIKKIEKNYNILLITFGSLLIYKLIIKFSTLNPLK